jgi:hypothetical protein
MGGGGGDQRGRVARRQWGLGNYAGFPSLAVQPAMGCVARWETAGNAAATANHQDVELAWEVFDHKGGLQLELADGLIIRLAHFLVPWLAPHRLAGAA